jgi:hypothetical protein
MSIPPIDNINFEELIGDLRNIITSSSFTDYELSCSLAKIFNEYCCITQIGYVCTEFNSIKNILMDLEIILPIVDDRYPFTNTPKNWMWNDCCNNKSTFNKK